MICLIFVLFLAHTKSRTCADGCAPDDLRFLYSSEPGKVNMVLNVNTEAIRLIRDGEKGGGDMEVGEEGDYIPIVTLSPPE